MSPADLRKAQEALLKNFASVQLFFIRLVARQIKKIGEMNQTSINRLIILADMNEDVSKVNEQLRQALNVSEVQLKSIYQQAATDVYTDPRFERVLNESPMSEVARQRLEQYTQQVYMQTAGTMTNLSNTTAVSSAYRQTVDKALLAVSSGVGDYQSATRQAIRDLGYNGLQVHYESGYHRRLDTALRQNITNGAKQIYQQGAAIMGQTLGYDAVEISAHAMSAPDHEPVQGHVFLQAEFQKMQNGESFQDIDGHAFEGFRRPIGEWNCMHVPMPFSTQYSKRKWTDDQLKQFIDENHKPIEIGGKKYTKYQAGQLMRQMETEVRRLKDAANAAREAGDDQLRKDLQKQINALSRRYAAVAQTAGLKMHKDRMAVEGFKMVKVD